MVRISRIVAEQLEEIRLSGECNMLDVNCVQSVAFNNEYHELVNFIADNRSEYAKLLFTGFEIEE